MNQKETTVERDLMGALKEWKDSTRRKPLVLEGVRQCGKTWLATEFGRTCFDKFAYVSLLDNPRMAALFEGGIAPDRLVPALSIESGVAISPHNTLIVLDEVQEVPRALTSLKYFCERAPEYPVLATGSSMGMTLHEGTSYPVGKVTIMRLFPLTFCEFLTAFGRRQLADAIREADLELLRVFHDELLEHLALYLVLGGMPEVVSTAADSLPALDGPSLQELQAAVNNAYRADFSRHEREMPRGLPTRLNQVWDSMPSQLARENKRFLYGAVRSGARGRDFELAIQWLQDMSLALKVPKANPPQYPLAMNTSPDLFKLFLSDVGLLSQRAGVSMRSSLEQDALFGMAKGAFAEQYVCQQLFALGYQPRYWQADNSSAELDFVIQTDGEAIPIEVKSGINLRSKSLKAAVKRFGYVHAIRFSPAKGGVDGVIRDIPLYAVEALPSLFARGA
jgi:predicted AAA+ superfamily ATPase